MSKLYVGNLSYQTDEETLRQAFSQDGRNVVSVAIIKDRETGQSRGFAFVEYASPSEADAAVRAMDGYEVDGRALRVNEARPRGSGGGGGGGGGGGYSGGGGGGGGGGGYAGGGGGGGYGGGGGGPPGGGGGYNDGGGGGGPPGGGRGGRGGRGGGSRRGGGGSGGGRGDW